MSYKNPIFYRFSQFIGFVIGVRLFATILLTFALYVSTYFLFNQEENLKNFIFDLKVHGIIFCTILTVLAGGIINQFYDKEKDSITKPFRTKIQGFFQQKYFLIAYISLNFISLLVAWNISKNVFIFFIVYQFLMWFYSHKLSKLLIINNIMFVSLTMYPFFGMLIYYQTFSGYIFLLASFLFFILLIIDIIKDTLTKNADLVFGYKTIPNTFSNSLSSYILKVLLFIWGVISLGIITKHHFQDLIFFYFSLSILVAILGLLFFNIQKKNKKVYWLTFLRIWLFIGVITMLINGILN